MCRTALDPRDQSPDQGQVTLRADLAAQPQPCLDHHGQCHPHNATLFLDTAFIGWHLSEVPWLFNQVLVHCLTLSPGADPPCGDGPLVEPKRCHNRLPGTPMGEQGHDDDHGFCRGAQPIADRPCGRAEGFVARVTDEPLLLPRMDPDIALARLASGRTVPIGAKDGCGVHDGPPSGGVWKHCQDEVCLDPIFSTTSPHHDWVWSYHGLRVCGKLGIFTRTRMICPMSCHGAVSRVTASISRGCSARPAIRGSWCASAKTPWTRATA